MKIKLANLYRLILSRCFLFSLKRIIRREIRKVVRSFVRSSTSVVTKKTVQTVSTSSSISSKEVTFSKSVIVTQEQEIIRGKCHVIDGDTIVIGKQKIRLAGIDAPELHNPYGKQAKWALIDLSKGQDITAQLTGELSYDRVVAKCFLDDGRDLAAEMVKLELALDIPHFPDADYKHLETPNARRKLRWRPNKK